MKHLIILAIIAITAIATTLFAAEPVVKKKFKVIIEITCDSLTLDQAAKLETKVKDKFPDAGVNIKLEEISPFISVYSKPWRYITGDSLKISN